MIIDSPFSREHIITNPDENSFHEIRLYEEVQEFIQADSLQKTFALRKKYLFFFGLRGGRTYFEDIVSVRKTLLSVFYLRILSQKENLSFEDFSQFAITAFEQDTKASLYIDTFGRKESSMAVVYRLTFKAVTYPRYLDEGIKAAQRLGYDCKLVGEKRARERILEVSSKRLPKSKENIGELINYIIDALFTIHLHDVYICTEKGLLIQHANSLVSSLWYSTAEAFRGGRTDRCKVCGKPFIAFNERGNKRLYCSGACNKKHQRLKLFKYHLDKGRSKEECAKIAKVRLSDGLEFASKTNST